MTSSPAIVVVGSLNADLVARVDRFPAPGETVRGSRFEVFPGGKGANQAYAAARLGGTVALIGQVGNDGYGDWLRTQLRDGGVDVHGVGTDAATSTGIAVITTDRTGENTIVVIAGANGRVTPERLESSGAAIERASVVLLQLEIPLEAVGAVAARARAGGARVILDPAPAAPLPHALLALASVVTPNETELAALAGHDDAMPPIATDDLDRLARRLIERGAPAVIVKRGERGARFVTAGRAIDIPAPAVEAVDTTAAGDAFNGALAVALAEGASMDAAMPFACAAASLSVTRPGAQPSMPDRQEVEAFLAARRGGRRS